MTLEPLTLSDMETIRLWRHKNMETLRTPYFLTEEMQKDYYLNTICNRDSKTRYWGLYEPEYFDDTGKKSTFMGYGGIENISWENRNGEISLLINPDYRGGGFGAEAVGLFLVQAFQHLNLETVYGECYLCGPWQFWEKMVEKYWGEAVLLPSRKYYDGKYYDSYYFTFHRRADGYYMRDTSESDLKEAVGKKR